MYFLNAHFIFADPFIDVIRNDIQKTYPRHIDRFTRLVSFSLYSMGHKTNKDLRFDTLRILLVKHGLRKTKSENYEKQLDYAHEFIGRFTKDRYDGDMATAGTNQFLSDVADYYHAIMDILMEKGIINEKKSRQAVVDLINEKIDDPFVRYILSKKIPGHLGNLAVYGKNLLKDIVQRINASKELEEAEKQEKAGYELPMDNFLYRKNVCQQFLELCFNRNDWVGNNDPIHVLWSYFYNQELFNFEYFDQESQQGIEWFGPIRLAPSQGNPFVIIFHTNHFYYMKNVHVSFEKAT